MKNTSKGFRAQTMSKKKGLKMRLLGLGVSLSSPGVLLAHGGDHSHVWGRHGDELSALLALLAIVGLGAFALQWWRSRG